MTLVRAVGVGPFDDYIPMMWEAFPSDDPDARWFDFKYVRGRSAYGLNKPAVFSKPELINLFALYRRVSGEQTFP
jgi:hypothetical protein